MILYCHPGFGCQTALIKIIDDWKKALDDNKFIAAILMDLSKAFKKSINWSCIALS
jgi:hypothetical protein